MCRKKIKMRRGEKKLEKREEGNDTNKNKRGSTWIAARCWRKKRSCRFGNSYKNVKIVSEKIQRNKMEEKRERQNVLMLKIEVIGWKLCQFVVFWRDEDTQTSQAQR